VQRVRVRHQVVGCSGVSCPLVALQIEGFPELALDPLVEFFQSVLLRHKRKNDMLSKASFLIIIVIISESR